MKKYVIIFDQIRKSGTVARLLPLIPTEEEMEFLQKTGGELTFFRHSRTKEREDFMKEVLERVLKEHKESKIAVDKIYAIRKMISYDVIEEKKASKKKTVDSNEDDEE